MQIFSLQENYLDEIFKDFPRFLNLLKIRALRRHRYLRKLKHQQKTLLNIKNKHYKSTTKEGEIKQIIINMKKARLTEDKMSYEDLAVMDIFSDDEVTVALNRQMIREKKDKSALIKAKKLQD